jgi:hypothetical protein
MYNTSKTNGEKESNRQKRNTNDQQHVLTNPPAKTPIRNAQTDSTPIRQHIPHLRSMPVRLRYDTSKTNGEKESNRQKRNRIDQQHSLTFEQKTSKRNAHAKSTPIRQHIPHLRSFPVTLMYDTSKTNG